MILVIDAGVWISALQFGGVPRQAIERALSLGRIAHCAKLTFEITAVLQKKFGWLPTEIERQLHPLLRDALFIEPTGTFVGACRDPKDDFVLECAQLAHADLVISGDKDLLSLQSGSAIHVLSPRQFLES